MSVLRTDSQKQVLPGYTRPGWDRGAVATSLLCSWDSPPAPSRGKQPLRSRHGRVYRQLGSRALGDALLFLSVFGTGTSFGLMVCHRLIGRCLLFMRGHKIAACCTLVVSSIRLHLYRCFQRHFVLAHPGRLWPSPGCSRLSAGGSCARPFLGHLDCRCLSAPWRQRSLRAARLSSPVPL